MHLELKRWVEEDTFVTFLRKKKVFFYNLFKIKFRIQNLSLISEKILKFVKDSRLQDPWNMYFGRSSTGRMSLTDYSINVFRRLDFP